MEDLGETFAGAPDDSLRPRLLHLPPGKTGGKDGQRLGGTVDQDEGLAGEERLDGVMEVLQIVDPGGRDGRRFPTSLFSGATICAAKSGPSVNDSRKTTAAAGGTPPIPP